MRNLISILFLLCSAFSSTILADLSELDLKGIPALWGQGVISPFDGQSSLYELAHYRSSPENYGEKKLPFPCHHQSCRVNRKDSPQSWPATMLQFLFPLPFVPNQATMYDPLHRLKHKRLAELIRVVSSLEQSGRDLMRDYRLFIDARERLLKTIYPLDGSLLRKNIQKDVDTAFVTIPAMFHDSQNFLANFQQAEDTLRLKLLAAAKSNQAKRIADHILSRSVAENFVNAILGTIFFADLDGKGYYKDFPTRVLYAYFSAQAETREEILVLYELLFGKSLIKFDREKRFDRSSYVAFAAEHTIAGEEEARNALQQRIIRVDDRRAWLLQQFRGGFGDPTRVEHFIDRLFGANALSLSFSKPDEFAAMFELANASQLSFPKIMRYKTATVTYAKQDKQASITHSDCGETTLRFFLGLGVYNDKLGVYDPEIWEERVRRYRLQPREGVEIYFSQGEGGKRSPYDDQKSSAHDSFSALVTSGLNTPGALGEDVLYTKPHDQPFTEINPGVDNVINAFQRIVGDAQDEEDYSSSNFAALVAPRRATLSLHTLNRLKREALSGASIEEHPAILGKFRKYQMNRFFKLISPLEGDGNSVFRWYAQTRDDELPTNFATLSVAIGGAQVEWEIEADHFDLSYSRSVNFTHRYAYLRDQILERLLALADNDRTVRSNLHRLLWTSTNLPTLPSSVDALSRALMREPELIYAFPLRTYSDQMRVAQWVLHHEIEALYPFITQWIAAFPTKSGDACMARIDMGHMFENILIDDNRAFPISPKRQLIDDVIARVAKPFVFGFTHNSGGRIVNNHVFARIMRMRGKDQDLVHSFFHGNTCGINPARIIANHDQNIAFEMFDATFPEHGRDWFKSYKFEREND